MFYYYGRKEKIFSYYPKPKYGTIIEPFAGSAAYSMNYYDRDVILVEKDKRIADLWAYLIDVSSDEILSLPLLVKGQSLNDEQFNYLTDNQKSLIGFFLNPGSAQPKKSPGKFCGWNEKNRLKLSNDVKVLMLPNLIGNKPDWKKIKEGLIAIGREDIILIEDSADTVTHTPETDIATTSFYASHVITAGGAGGMVMFNEEKYRNTCLQFRDWGRIGDNSEEMSDRFNHSVDGIPYDYKFLYGVLGYNMKSSEMNAAFGLVQLDRFSQFEKIRRDNIERYLENLKDVEEILLPDDSIKPNWLAIPLQTEKRYEI